MNKWFIFLAILLLPFVGRSAEIPESARLFAEGLREVAEAKEEPARARGWAKIRKAASAGDADACFYLGTKLPPDEGTPFIAKAAEASLLPAQLALALRHLSGVGAKEDSVLAYYWYRRAASNGGNADLAKQLWGMMTTEDKERAWKVLAGKKNSD
jgi:TPR repeat protein